VNRKPGSKSWFFGLPPYFYFRFRLYGHQDGRFCLICACTAQWSVLDGTNWLSSSKPCEYCRIAWSELKPEVVFKVQKMARYASFCLIMGPFEGELPVFARLSPVRPPWRASRYRLSHGPGNIRVRVRVSFTTGALRSAILATAGLLVLIVILLGIDVRGLESRRSINTKIRPNSVLSAISLMVTAQLFAKKQRQIVIAYLMDFYKTSLLLHCFPDNFP